MRKIDLICAWDRFNDIQEFCDELDIDIDDYGESIYSDGGATEYIKNRCNDYLARGDLVGLRNYINRQYIPAWFEFTYLDCDGNMREFDSERLKYFMDLIEKHHRYDPDWNDTDDSRFEGNETE